MGFLSGVGVLARGAVSVRGGAGVAARGTAGGNAGGRALDEVGVRGLLWPRRGGELAVSLSRSHCDVERDHGVPDCGGVAFGEAGGIASIAIESSLLDAHE